MGGFAKGRYLRALKLVLDTNVWLDLLVFHDPGADFLRDERYQIFADVRCAEELERVLGYPFALKLLGDQGAAAVMAVFSRRAKLISAGHEKLPRCQDADDQKFL